MKQKPMARGSKIYQKDELLKPQNKTNIILTHLEDNSSLAIKDTDFHVSGIVLWEDEK